MQRVPKALRERHVNSTQTKVEQMCDEKCALLRWLHGRATVYRVCHSLHDNGHTLHKSNGC